MRARRRKCWSSVKNSGAVTQNLPPRTRLRAPPYYKRNNKGQICLEAKTPGGLPGVIEKHLATESDALDQGSIARNVYLLQVVK